jgi:hypothetical protein
MSLRRLLAVAALAAAATLAAGGSATADADLCGQVPRVNIQRNDLGFHVGNPDSEHAGTRGHAKVNLSTGAVTGIMCQVDSDHTGVLLSIGKRIIHASHHAVMFGVPGNILTTNVHVTKTTDPACTRGTKGTLTVFASYNNIVKDSVQLSFPAACKSHSVRYKGKAVVTNVPPN